MIKEIKYIVGEKNDEYLYDKKFTISVLSNDTIVQETLKKAYIFGKYITMAIYAFCDPNDNILDIGANVGCVTIPCAKNFTVYAFEPFKQNYTLLLKNIAQNKVSSVIAFNNAVGHTKMKTSLSPTINLIDNKSTIIGEINLDSQSKLNYGAIQLGLSGQNVQMIKIDDEFKTIPISLMKVDVEGAEPLVFYGAQEVIKRDMPIIIFEKNWQTITNDMKKAMNLSDEIINFDILDYCHNLGYDRLIHIHLEDYMIVPSDRSRVFFDKRLKIIPVKSFNNKYKCFKMKFEW